MLKLITFRLFPQFVNRAPKTNRVFTKFTQKKWYSTFDTDDSTELRELAKIDKAIARNEAIKFYGDHAIHQTTRAFMRTGFTELNAKKVINGYPNILRLSSHELIRRLEMWRFCNFSNTQYYELFVQCPELIELTDEQALAKRYSQLQMIVSTEKNIWRLLMSCPNVLVDDFSTIQKKVDYVLNKMEADVTDLVKSGTLGLPLEKIQARHTLLVRLGIYKKRNWKASELSDNKNLRLFRITDVDDVEFSTKTCRITMNEFEAFTELYEREMAENAEAQKEYEQDDDLESDEESENDDENFDAREHNDYYDDRKKRKYKRKY